MLHFGAVGKYMELWDTVAIVLAGVSKRLHTRRPASFSIRFRVSAQTLLCAGCPHHVLAWGEGMGVTCRKLK